MDNQRLELLSPIWGLGSLKIVSYTVSVQVRHLMFSVKMCRNRSLWGCEGTIWSQRMQLQYFAGCFLEAPRSNHAQPSGMTFLLNHSSWSNMQHSYPFSRCYTSCSFLWYHIILGMRHLLDSSAWSNQGNDRGTQYRSGIYFYSPEQEKAALESKEQVQKTLSNPIVTEILPAKKFYRAEEYHQQYLAKGGRGGNAQSPAKGCTDPIRCYGWACQFCLRIATHRTRLITHLITIFVTKLVFDGGDQYFVGKGDGSWICAGPLGCWNLVLNSLRSYRSWPCGARDGVFTEVRICSSVLSTCKAILCDVQGLLLLCMTLCGRQQCFGSKVSVGHVLSVIEWKGKSYAANWTNSLFSTIFAAIGERSQQLNWLLHYSDWCLWGSSIFRWHFHVISTIWYISTA